MVFEEIRWMIVHIRLCSLITFSTFSYCLISESSFLPLSFVYLYEHEKGAAQGTRGLCTFGPF